MQSEVDQGRRYLLYGENPMMILFTQSPFRRFRPVFLRFPADSLLSAAFAIQLRLD